MKFITKPHAILNQFDFLLQNTQDDILSYVDEPSSTSIYFSNITYFGVNHPFKTLRHFCLRHNKYGVRSVGLFWTFSQTGRRMTRFYSKAHIILAQILYISQIAERSLFNQSFQAFNINHPGNHRGVYEWKKTAQTADVGKIHPQCLLSSTCPSSGYSRAVVHSRNI